MKYRICKNAIGKYKIQEKNFLFWCDMGLCTHTMFEIGKWSLLLYDTIEEAKEVLNSYKEKNKIDKLSRKWECKGEYYGSR